MQQNLAAWISRHRWRRRCLAALCAGWSSVAAAGCAALAAQAQIRDAERTVVAAERGATELGLAARSAGAAPAASPGAGATTLEAGAVLTLERAISLAVARSPALTAALRRAHAQLEAARAEAALPAAALELQLWNLPATRPYAVDEVDMVMLELRQTLPPAGQRDALASAMVAEAEEITAMALAERQALVERVVEVYSRWLESGEKVAILARQAELLTRVQHVQAARTATGGAALVEGPRLALEQTRIARAALRAEAERASAVAALRALLGLGLQADLGAPVRSPEQAAAVDGPALLALASRERGAARAARARVVAAGQRVRAAVAAARRPEVMLGLGLWQSPDMRPGLGLSASITLPWLWGPARARVAEARHAEAATRAEEAAQSRSAAGELGAALAQVRAAEAQLAELRQRALPAARRGVEALTAAYASGATTLPEWLEASRLELELELDESELHAELSRGLAALDRVVGAPVPRAARPRDASLEQPPASPRTEEQP